MGEKMTTRFWSMLAGASILLVILAALAIAIVDAFAIHYLFDLYGWKLVAAVWLFFQLVPSKVKS